jgi:hypothetical protein
MFVLPDVCFDCLFLVVFHHFVLQIVLVYLKVLTNEKRGGLKVATFDWSRFKLFSLKFSAKSVKALSCERLKTTQRTLFLSFEIKNCFPITVLRRSFMKKSGKLACHVVNWNIAIDSSPKLQISLEVIALFEKIYDGGPILTVISNIGEDVQYRCFK